MACPWLIFCVVGMLVVMCCFLCVMVKCIEVVFVVGCDMGLVCNDRALVELVLSAL